MGSWPCFHHTLAIQQVIWIREPHPTGLLTVKDTLCSLFHLRTQWCKSAWYWEPKDKPSLSCRHADPASSPFKQGGHSKIQPKTVIVTFVCSHREPNAQRDQFLASASKILGDPQWANTSVGMLTHFLCVCLYLEPSPAPVPISQSDQDLQSPQDPHVISQGAIWDPGHSLYTERSQSSHCFKQAEEVLVHFSCALRAEIRSKLTFRLVASSNVD